MTDTADAIGPSAVVKARSDVTTVELGDEIVIYDDSTGKLHHLNPQGGVLWRWLDGSGPLADLAADVSAAYEADRAAVEADVVALARSLASRGLLEDVGDGGRHPSDEEGGTARFLPEPPNP